MERPDLEKVRGPKFEIGDSVIVAKAVFDLKQGEILKVIAVGKRYLVDDKGQKSNPYWVVQLGNDLNHWYPAESFSKAD